MDDTNVGPGMVNHRKHCQCLECAYQNVLAERDGLLSARDDLGRSNARLQIELDNASEEAARYEGMIATLTARVTRLTAAIETAYRHLDMAALRVSHAVDARVIESAMRGSDQPSGGQS